MKNDVFIRSDEDLKLMLDKLLRDEQKRWDNFYKNTRIKNLPVPFIDNKPDENLVAYFKKGQLHSGNVLELGCGPGRNAIYFAKQGCQVTAIDISEEAIRWAEERMEKEKINVDLHRSSIFDMVFKKNYFDIIYDSGCLHHIVPHRRADYLNIINKALKTNGFFGLNCFRPGVNGSAEKISDLDVYKNVNMPGGGISYSEEELRYLFEDYFDFIEFRKMEKKEQED